MWQNVFMVNILSLYALNSKRTNIEQVFDNVKRTKCSRLYISHPVQPQILGREWSEKQHTGILDVSYHSKYLHY